MTTSYGTLFVPTSWNGFKIYLSSARHATSGSRGECGWEENRNARNWNMYAADGAGIPNIRSRGYYVEVSPNNREAPEGQGAVKNKDASNNWGAHVHIVTHTNASPAGGCPQTAQYLLVQFRTGVANSTGLRTELITRLDPTVPGGNNTWNCDTWTECTNVIATHRAYVELFFHTNQAAVNWFQAGGGGHGVSAAEAWRYGWAIDQRLGYPR